MQSAVYPNKAVFKTAPIIQLYLFAVIIILHLLASFTSVQRQSFRVLVSTQDILPSTIKNKYNAPIKSAIWNTTYTLGYYRIEDGYDLFEWRLCYCWNHHLLWLEAKGGEYNEPYRYSEKHMWRSRLIEMTLTLHILQNYMVTASSDGFVVLMLVI